MNSIGDKAEKAVKQIVEECIKPKKLRVNPVIHKGTKKQLDLIAVAEKEILNIEVKSKIPAKGSKSLRRLRDQLLESQKANKNVKLVGGEKVSNETLSETVNYLKRAGVDTSSVDIFNGLTSFAKWSAEMYFEECIEY